MKRTTFLAALLAVAFVTQAQNDTKYVKTSTSNTITDVRDGKIYKTVTIGSQTWMAENLAYLPQVDTVTTGSEDVAGEKYYYVYDFAPKKGDREAAQVTAAKATTNYKTYGVLYNWYAAMNGATSTNTSKVQGACPAGWHLPTYAEWTQITDYLGGSELAGNKLKATTNWTAFDKIANTNEVKFTAIPNGTRTYYDTYESLGTIGLWWCTSEGSADSDAALGMYMYYAINTAGLNNNNKNYGFSVRCLRD